MMGFRKASERLLELRTGEAFIEPISFANKFLDDALGGLYPDDLVVVTARTGAGKTEIASQIASTAAIQGKNVHLFALEAYEGEIELRTKFKVLSQAFFAQPHWRNCGETPSFQEWVYGKQDHLLGHFDKEVTEFLKRTLKSLNIYYRNEDFTIETFEAHMAAIGQSTDLVIVDHLHYFDFDSEKENQEVRRTVKQIRDLTMFYRKPTVLVAHIRKQDKRYQSHTPELEDIYGSSDITKIANKIVAAAPARDLPQNDPNIVPTYLKILKNRLDGSRSNYVAVCGFNVHKNSYEDDYTLGKTNYEGDFEAVEKLPFWAKRHSRILQRDSGGPSKPIYDPSNW